jgi:hypothetical protein
VCALAREAVVVLHRPCQASRCRAQAVRTGVSLDLENGRVASLAARSLRARVVARVVVARAVGSELEPPQASRCRVGSQGRADRVVVEAAGRVAVAGAVLAVAVPAVTVAVPAVSVAVAVAMPGVLAAAVFDGWLDEPLEVPGP